MNFNRITMLKKSWLQATLGVATLSLASLAHLGMAAPADELAAAQPVAVAPASSLTAEEQEAVDRMEQLFADVDAGERTLREVIAAEPEAFALYCEVNGFDLRHVVLEDMPFAADICEIAEEHGMDSLLIASVVEVESVFKAKAGSHKGAVGLMQLLPSTAGMSRSKLLDPRTNLEAGTKYLKEMLERFDGDLELALAAYNAGPTNVRRYDGVPPFAETQSYVEKVLAIYATHHREASVRNAGDVLLAQAG